MDSVKIQKYNMNTSTLLNGEQILFDKWHKYVGTDQGLYHVYVCYCRRCAIKIEHLSNGVNDLRVWFREHGIIGNRNIPSMAFTGDSTCFSTSNSFILEKLSLCW